MSDRLDDLMARLAASPADHPLDGLEAELGRRIGARRREAQAASALTPVRMASLGLALAVGVTVGGAVATGAAPAAPGAFAVARLAPSNLLEGGE